MSKEDEEVADAKEDGTLKLTIRDCVNKEDSAVYINKKTISLLNLTGNDSETVLLRGKSNKESVGLIKSDESVPDNTVEITRMMRNNLRLVIGDDVCIKKCLIKVASKVTVALFADTMNGLIGNLMDVFIKPQFNLRPIHLDDTLIARRCFRDVTFKVVEMDPGPFCVVDNSKTQIFCLPMPIKREEEEKTLLEVGFQDIGGYRKELGKVKEIIGVFLKHTGCHYSNVEPSNKILLHGPAGTGKTTIGRAMASENRMNFILVDFQQDDACFQLDDAYFYAESSGRPTIIFIRNISIAVAKINQDIIGLLLKFLKNRGQTNNIFVIASTDRPASLPNVLRTAAYFDCSAEVEIGPPSKKERLEILKSLTRNWNLAKDVNLKEFVSKTYKLVGADLGKICAQVKAKKIIPVEGNMDADVLNADQVSKQDFHSALPQVGYLEGFLQFFEGPIGQFLLHFFAPWTWAAIFGLLSFISILHNII